MDKPSDKKTMETAMGSLNWIDNPSRAVLENKNKVS